MLGTKATTQVDDSNFRQSTIFPEPHPVTSPPTNQKKVTHPAALIPNFAYKNFSLKAMEISGFSEHEQLFSLLGPVISLCSKL